MDILAVEVGMERENYLFQIRTGGRHLRNIFEEYRHRAQFSVYIDRDWNGTSDLFLTTTTEPDLALALTNDFEVMQELELEIRDNSLTFRVPIEQLGRSFDWIATSGYSPSERAFHPTPIQRVFSVPQVDQVIPRQYFRNIELWTTYQSTVQCQLIETGYHTCPVPGVPSVQVPHLPPNANTQYHQGVMIHREMCGDKGHELWCVQCCFGRRPYIGSWQGWIARCPYVAGNNSYYTIKNPTTNALERVIHTVKDGPPSGNGSLPPYDSDHDNLYDIMQHDYNFNTNNVTSSNIELDPYTKAQVNVRSLPPRLPYTNLYEVPGYIP